MERCFQEGLAQGVQQSKSHCDARVALADAWHTRKAKELKAQVDKLGEELRLARFSIGGQKGLLSMKNQEIAKLRSEKVRLIQEASGEGQPVVAHLNEEIQRLSAVLQKIQSDLETEKKMHQANKDYAEAKYGQVVQERAQAISMLGQIGKERDQAVQKENQALQERDWAVQKMSEAVQERDQALQKMFEAVEERDQALKQLQSVCQENRAMPDISHAQLLQQEKDEAIQAKDRAEKKCHEVQQEGNRVLRLYHDALQEKNGLRQLQQGREDDQARAGSYSKLQQEKDQAVEALDDMTRQRDQLLLQIDQLRQEDHQENDYDDLMLKVDTLVTELSCQQAQYDDLMAETERLKEEKAKLEGGKEQAATEIGQLRADMFMVELDRDQLRDRVDALEVLLAPQQSCAVVDRSSESAADSLHAEVAGLSISTERQEPEE